jgi:hypothetical protein
MTLIRSFKSNYGTQTHVCGHDGNTRLSFLKNNNKNVSGITLYQSVWNGNILDWLQVPVRTSYRNLARVQVPPLECGGLANCHARPCICSGYHSEVTYCFPATYPHTWEMPVIYKYPHNSTRYYIIRTDKLYHCKPSVLGTRAFTAFTVAIYN